MKCFFSLLSRKPETRQDVVGYVTSLRHARRKKKNIVTTIITQRSGSRREFGCRLYRRPCELHCSWSMLRNNEVTLNTCSITGRSIYKSIISECRNHLGDRKGMTLYAFPIQSRYNSKSLSSTMFLAYYIMSQAW